MSNIKVRALAKGFYRDSLVEPGQEFLLIPIVVKRLKKDTTKVYESVSVSAEDQFSDEWMEVVNEDMPKEKSNVIPFDPNFKGEIPNSNTGDSGAPKGEGTILTGDPAV